MYWFGFEQRENVKKNAGLDRGYYCYLTLPPEPLVTDLILVNYDHVSSKYVFILGDEMLIIMTFSSLIKLFITSISVNVNIFMKNLRFSKNLS